MKGLIVERLFKVYPECVFVLLVLATPSQPCTSYGNQDGRCVLFQECPPLSDILEKARNDSASLRLLQQLTFRCGFHGSTPKVCCPLNIIKLTDGPVELAPELNSGHVGIGDVNSNTKQNERPFLSSHPNFRLLPLFDRCSSNSIADRVVGGTAAPHGSYPWLVRVGYKVFKTGGIVHGCGGSILNDQYILSAAHCVQNLGDALGPDQIRLAEHNTETNPDCSRDFGCTNITDIKIEEIIVHPQYEVGSKQNDICLIRLRNKISFDSASVQPICLPFIQEFGIQNFPTNLDGQIGIVAGFGKTRWNKAAGTMLLQHVQLPILSNSKCQDIYSAFSRLRISSNQICAGGVPGKDSCDGDSGGGLVLIHHDKVSDRSTTFLTGVVSFGPRQCGGPAEIPSVYTRTTSYLKWILDTIRD